MVPLKRNAVTAVTRVTLWMQRLHCTAVLPCRYRAEHQLERWLPVSFDLAVPLFCPFSCTTLLQKLQQAPQSYNRCSGPCVAFGPAQHSAATADQELFHPRASQHRPGLCRQQHLWRTRMRRLLLWIECLLGLCSRRMKTCSRCGL
jgi:hypothetical protein